MMKPADTLSHLPPKPPEESDAGVIAARLHQLGADTADCAVILGSGLSGFVQLLAHRKHIPYHLVDGLPETAVSGHPGELVSGMIGRRRILAWAGRFHAYAGYAPSVQTLPVRISHALGVRHLLVTNAAGGILDRLRTGDIMLIDDFIDFSSLHHSILSTHTQPGAVRRAAPASSRKTDAAGSLHSTALQPNGPCLRQPVARFSGRDNNRLAASLACKHGIYTERGCYMFVPGPCYETPAETSAYRLLGADAVGMSTTAELREAARLGMNSAGISLISNAAATAGSHPPCHNEVLRAAKKHSARLERLLALLLTDIESPFYSNLSEPE